MEIDIDRPMLEIMGIIAKALGERVYDRCCGSYDNYDAEADRLANLENDWLCAKWNMEDPGLGNKWLMGPSNSLMPRVYAAHAEAVAFSMAIFWAFRTAQTIYHAGALYSFNEISLGEDGVPTIRVRECYRKEDIETAVAAANQLREEVNRTMGEGFFKPVAFHYPNVVKFIPRNPDYPLREPRK